MKEKILSSLILMLLLCSVFAGLSQLPGTALATKVTFVACRGVDESRTPWVPVDVTNSFASTDRYVYLLVVIEDVNGPLRVTIKVFDPQGKLFDQQYGDWKAGSYTWIALRSRWEVAKMAPGEWRGEAYADGQLISTLKFTLHPAIEIVYLEATIDGRKYTMGMTIEKPAVVYPGEVITLRIDARNNGQETVKAMRVVFEDFTPKDVLTVVESSPAQDLTPGATVTWTIKMRAEKPGETTGKLRMYLAGQKVSEVETPFKIRELEIELVEKTVSPKEGEPVYPSDTVTATYKLKNNRETTAKNIKVTLETPLPENVKLLESTTAKDIKPGATEEFVIKLKADKEGSYSGKILVYTGEVVIQEWKWTLEVSPLTFWIRIQMTGTAFIGIIALILIILALSLIHI